MGLRFRKSIKLPLGFRVNLSKSGIGYSYGFKGYRHTVMANGRTRDTISIPKTGISYVKETKGTEKCSNSTYNQKSSNQSYIHEPQNIEANTVITTLREQILSKASNIQTYKGLFGKKKLSDVLFSAVTIWVVSFLAFAIALSPTSSGSTISNLMIFIMFLFHGYIFVQMIKEIRTIIKTKELTNQVDEQVKACLKFKKYNQYTVHANNLEEYNSFNSDVYIAQNESIMEANIKYINECEQQLVNQIRVLDNFIDYIKTANIRLRKRELYKIIEYIQLDENFIDIKLLEICIDNSEQGVIRTAGLYTVDDINTIIYEHKKYMEDMKEYKRRIAEDKQRQEDERIQRERQEQQKKQAERDQKRNDKLKKELNSALSLFMLDIPFSMDELKKQRNRLIKSFHSDNNSDDVTKYAVKINAAYELLRKYATD